MKAGFWAPFFSTARNGPSRLNPSGIAPSTRRRRHPAPDPPGELAEHAEAGRHGGRQERGDAVAQERPGHPVEVPRVGPIASWPPQPWTWTSTKPGAMIGPAASASSSSTSAIRRPRTTSRPGATRSVEDQPAADDAFLHRSRAASQPYARHLPPRPPTSPPGSPPGRWPGRCGRPRRRTRRPARRSAIRRRTSARTSSGVPAAKDALRVHAAAPEDEVAPEVALERRAVHARRGDLDRVEDVDPDLDEVGNQVPDRRRRCGRRPSPRCAPG